MRIVTTDFRIPCVVVLSECIKGANHVPQAYERFRPGVPLTNQHEINEIKTGKNP